MRHLPVDKDLLRTFAGGAVEAPSTGMRKGELVALNVADFSFERQELAIVEEQIQEGQVVPVGEYARHFTEAYLQAVRPWLTRAPMKRRLFL